MIQFFNTYPEFSADTASALIYASEQIISDHNLTLEYTNVVFMTDDELLKLNVEYLGHDYYTDIITFNYAEEPGKVEAELYISTDRVRENAITNDVSLIDEMKRVVIHGMLHIAGFNDSSLIEKSEMRSLEDKYINKTLFHVKQNNDKMELK